MQGRGLAGAWPKVEWERGVCEWLSNTQEALQRCFGIRENPHLLANESLKWPAWQATREVEIASVDARPVPRTLVNSCTEVMWRVAHK